jgi:hypothetical protein
MMSTYQPPGGQPPEGTPAYTPPQDPWSGNFDHGLASVPTDPIPQQYGPSYPQGQADMWSQQTVPPVGAPPQYDYVPQQPPKGKAGLIVGVFVLVLVLGGGGGFAAWYVTTHRASGAGPVASSSTVATKAPTPTPVSTAFNPYTVKEGDCLVNKGTEADPQLAIASCSTVGSFKVIKVAKGAAIPEGPGNKFDRDTTSVSECQGTGYQSWYGYKDALSPDRDLFFCLTNN